MRLRFFRHGGVPGRHTQMPGRKVCLAGRYQLATVALGLCALLGLWTIVHAPVARQGRDIHQPDSHSNLGAMLPIPIPAPVPPPFTFPDGGRQLMPNFRLVALYGEPSEPALGALGEQPLADTIARAEALAAAFQPLCAQRVMPALEVITTVASDSPTANGDYSREVDAASLQPWIDAARAAGVYVVLDLQPGRTDFLTQAKEYQALLAQPNVGLALDPEWRLAAGEQPLMQIGSVSINEVNATIAWLANLTAADNLPQKLFVLHQFRLSMLPGRAQLDTSHANLAYIIQMDGQGAQQTKQSTWQIITAAPPPNVDFGWKNFYHKDSPVLTPEQTMQIAPQPWYVSYQ